MSEQALCGVCGEPMAPEESMFKYHGSLGPCPVPTKAERYKKMLEEAPDHLSDEFLDYLRANNVVVADTYHWLLIENFKYNTPEKRHYTAFAKKNGHSDMPMSLYHDYCKGWEILVKRKSDRTVKRWHVHFIE